MKKFLAFWSGLSAFVRDVVIAGVLLALFLALVLFLKPAHPKPIVTENSAPLTTTVQLPGKETIVYKDVIKYVEDKENVKRLLDENKKLKLQITQLSETLAHSTSSGGGTITPPPPAAAGTPAVPVPDTGYPPLTWSDWRLRLNVEGFTLDYTLTQKFEVLTATGKNDKGIPTTTVKLFELDKDGKRLPIEVDHTTVISVLPKTTRWHVFPSVIGGAGVAVKDGERTPGALVGARWLARGTSRAAEDSTYAVLTPVAFLSDSVKEPGLLPVSFNFGSIKHQPFRDLWVSPYVGFDVKGRTVSRIGLAFTASF